MSDIIINRYLNENKDFYDEKIDFSSTGTIKQITPNLEIKTVSEGQYKGRKYRVVTVEGMKYSNPLFRYLSLIPLLSLTLLSAGTVLLFPYVQNLWSEFWTGRTVKKINLLIDEPPQSPAIQKTDKVSLPTITNQETQLAQTEQKRISSPSNPAVPIPSGKKETAPPVPMTPGKGTPKATIYEDEKPFFDLYNKIEDTKQPAILPPLNSFTPELNSPLKKGSQCLDGINTKDNQVMKYSLSHFLSLSHFGIFRYLGISLLNVKIFVERIKERIEAYNKAIQLEERLCSIKDKPHYLCNLTIGDLDAAWEDSAFKIAFMPDDEIRHLTMSQIQKLTQNQLDFLLKISSSLKSEELDSTGLNFEHLKLMQLHSLPQETLNRLIGQIHVKMLPLFSQKQLDSVPVSLLNDVQFQLIYGDLMRIHRLKMPLLGECIGKLYLLLPEMLNKLITPQVQSLDFSNPKITEPVLTAMASLNNPDKSKRGLAVKWMTADQICLALNRGLLTVDTANHITSLQVAKIDFLKVQCLQKDVIATIFANRGNVKAIRNKESLHALIPLLNQLEHLAYLTQEQVGWLDFSDANINRDFITAIANLKDSDKSKRGQTTKWMSGDQLLLALNRELLTIDTAVYILPTQVAKIDFTKVQCTQKEVISTIFENRANIKEIKNKDSLYALIRLLNQHEVLAFLTKEQISWLDFLNGGPVSPSVWQGIIGKDKKLLSTRMNFLVEEQIREGLKRKLFDQQQCDCISVALLKKLSQSDLVGYPDLQAKVKKK